MKPKKVIKHLGKETNTINYIENLSNETYLRFKNTVLHKPSIEEVSKEIINLCYGKSCASNLTLRYFTESLRLDCKKKGSKYSITELLKSKDLVGYIISKMIKSSLYETSSDNLDFSYEDVRKVFTLTSKGMAERVGGYRITTLLKIFDKYPAFNGNYYDFSCGWGDRLLGSLKSGYNYYGTDPNFKVVEKLKELDSMVKRIIIPKENLVTDIRPQGSEISVPEWSNTISLAFSSPPYYDIEQYIHGDQSYKPGVSYREWIDNYKVPTIKNIYTYLVKGGHFIINTKSYSHAPIPEDVVRISEEVGFKYVECINNKLGIYSNTRKDIIEGIYVFQK